MDIQTLIFHPARPSKGFKGRRRFREPTPPFKTLGGARWGASKSWRYAAPHFERNLNF
jgi:hypothetical protein